MSTTNISISLPRTKIKELDREANREKRSRSSMILVLIDEALVLRKARAAATEEPPCE